MITQLPLLLLFGVIWLGISTLVFSFTLRYAVTRIRSRGLGILAVIGIAAVLSPGLMIGHGAMPFPGGLAYIWLGLIETRYLVDPAALVNLAWWIVTATVFLFLPDPGS